MLLAKSYSEYLVCYVMKLEWWLCFIEQKLLQTQQSTYKHMKEHNEMVKFKNSFISDPKKHQKLDNILSEDVSTVLSDKLKAVASLYRSQAAENGYSANLAYRVIIIHLLSSSPHQGFDAKQQISRFFKHCLAKGQLQGLRMCFDLLLLKELSTNISVDMIRLLKAKVLRGLREYYTTNHQGKQKRKCAYMLHQYCKDALNREQVKRNSETYTQILDILIEQVKRKVSSFLKKKDKILALEHLAAFTQVLEKSEQIVSKKYQLQLMEAYWSLARLHQQMHYQAYTKKYAAIALNIAERTEMHSQAKQIRQLLDRLL